MTAELVCAATDPAWLERRREGITATDIVTIAGLVTWDSPWALYHRKLGLLPEVEQSDRMRLGSWLEEAIASYWHTSRDQAVAHGELYRSSARPWQMATPDRLVAAYRDSTWLPLECKTSATRDGWGPDGSDQVPPHVRAQVLWQMDTLGVAVGHVAVVFLPSGEFRSYTIRHDEDEHQAARNDPPDVLTGCHVCQEIDGLRDLGFGFWSRILRKEPPDLDGLEVTTDALRYLHPAPGGQVDLINGQSLVRDFDLLATSRKVAEEAYREAQNAIRQAMGDAHEATVDGRVVFRRTIGKRAGYTVAPGETDTLRRIGKDKTDGD